MTESGDVQSVEDDEVRWCDIQKAIAKAMDEGQE